MYCSSCGEIVALSLTYCNHCGAKLRSGKDDGVAGSSEVKPELLVCAMAGVFILGLVAIAVLVGILKQVAGLELPFLLVTIMFSFMMMLIVEGVFIRLLLKRRKVVTEFEGATDRLSEKAPKELYGKPARSVAEPLPSVIEQTTNQLDPVYRDLKSK
jgi:hypothetical protein